jgi:hypothetical protein
MFFSERFITVTRHACVVCGSKFERAKGTARIKCFTCAPARITPSSGGLAHIPVNPVPADDQPQSPSEPPTPGDTEQAVIDELTELGWLRSVDGVMARGLARSLDDYAIPGAQRTSLSKQLSQMMMDIRAQAPKPRDVVNDLQDEIARKRREAMGL